MELLFIIGAAVNQLQGEKRLLFVIRPGAPDQGAAGAPLLTCAHGYATDIQESLEMLEVSPSILDRVSCLSVSSSSIDLGLGLGSLHTGYTYLHSWKRSWTGSWIPRTARRQSGSSIDLDRLSIYRSRRYVVTLLGPLMAVNCSRRYVVTLLGPWLDGLWQSPVWGHLTWTVARRLIAVTGMGSFDLDR